MTSVVHASAEPSRARKRPKTHTGTRHHMRAALGIPLDARSLRADADRRCECTQTRSKTELRGTRGTTETQRRAQRRVSAPASLLWVPLVSLVTLSSRSDRAKRLALDHHG